MNLRSLTRSSEAVPDEKAVRQARVKAARRVGWEEIPKERLRPRGRGWLVDAESDRVFTIYRGATFERGSATIIPDRNRTLAFYLDDEGWPVVLEPLGRTWSEIYARHVQREQRLAAQAAAPLRGRRT